MNIYTELNTIACFGVAGNFAGHLEQAGEAKDFEKVKTVDVNAPKAVFPTYIPLNSNNDSVTPEFLHCFPFDAKKIIFPKGEQKLQIEPECGIVFQVQWNQNKIEKLKPIAFGASNDCSIRKEGAKKISQKKNWGNSTKGLSDHLIPLEEFTENSILNEYSIASFLIRQGNFFEYGETSPVRTYSYIYEKLTDWLIEKLNNQQDEGPAENINSYLVENKKPEKVMISIGATRYTKWGEENFLQKDDIACVILFPNKKYNLEDIKNFLIDSKNIPEDISVLCQEIQA